MQEPSPIFLLLRILKLGIPSILLLLISLFLLDSYYWSVRFTECIVVEGVCGTVGPKLDEETQLGKQLFRQYCAMCHYKDMYTDLTGPALGEATLNWQIYPEEDLYNWIRNSQKMIEQQHPRAIELWDSWQPTIMPKYERLSDEEIKAILTYIDAMYTL